MFPLGHNGNYPKHPMAKIDKITGYHDEGTILVSLKNIKT